MPEGGYQRAHLNFQLRGGVEAIKEWLTQVRFRTIIIVRNRTWRYCDEPKKI